VHEDDIPRSDHLADLWRARFGQPPPILADSETMLRVLKTVGVEGGGETTPAAPVAFQA